MTDNTIHDIPLEQLRDSPFNPRKTFLDIEALAQDIKSDGRILQPLLVRPVPDLGGDCFEVVFGHRRLRAARLAELASAPCMVRQMSDEEARRAQIRENLQRNDVHPIEEAEGFAALMHEHGVSAEQIAQQVGRSLSYVHGRIKLLLAVPKVREACLAGRIGSETALLIARLRTPKLQEKALAAIDAKYLDLEDGGKKSFRRIRELLAERFTLDLKRAIFDTAAPELLPIAGPCTTCAKRTGNAPEYADLLQSEEWDHYARRRGNADACTDPDCFEAKKKAHLQLKAEELEAKGETVVTGNKARAATSAEGEVKGDYVPLAEVRDALKKVAADKKPTVATIINPRNGKTVKAVKREDLQAAGVKVKAAEPKRQDRENYAEQQRRWEQERKERERAQRIEHDYRKAVAGAVLETMASQPRTAFDLRIVAFTTWRYLDWEARKELAKRYGLASDNDTTMRRKIDQLDAEALAVFCVECVLVDEIVNTDEKAETLLEAAKHYGVDAEAIRKRGEEADAREVKPAAKVAAKKKAAAKKAKGDPAQVDLVEEAGA